MSDRSAEKNKSYILRNVEDLALETLQDTPVMVVQGARQVGKSTLAARMATKLNARQVSFDNPMVLQAAKYDPISFVEQWQQGTLIIDEVQRFPQILRAIKLAVDENRRPGQFILTGSADLLHISGANESLAGRAETIYLYPFSQGELLGYKEDFIANVLEGIIGSQLPIKDTASRDEYATIIERGGYPEAVAREPRRRRSFFKNYLSSVLDHDAVQLSGLAHLDKLSTLFSLLSAQSSSELVKANLAKLVGIPETSIHAYIRLLDNLCLTHELPAWGRNLSNRVIGRKKLSISDVGLASYLNGKSAESLLDLSGGEAFGSMLEGLAISELFKQQTWAAQEYSLFHYRDKDQREADIIVELRDGRILALEVKATKTVTSKHFKGLRYLRDSFKERFISGIVLYTGHETLSFGDKLLAVPLCRLWM